MLAAFAAAIVVVGLPALALGAALAPLCGDDDGARALGPVAGLAVLILVGLVLAALGVGGPALAVAPITLGVIGAAVALQRRVDLRALLWPTLAAAIVIAIMAWPFRFVPGPGVLGYDVANDSPVHAILADYLRDGRSATVPGSTFAEIAAAYRGGYPVGGHALVAAVAALGPDVLDVYDPAMAVIVSLGAFAAYWLLRRSGVPPPLSVLGAVLSAGGYLQLEYYGQGFLPQMAAAPLVLGAFGLGYEALRTGRRGPAFLAGLVLGAALTTYSIFLGVYVVPALVVAAAGFTLRASDRVARLRTLGLQVGLAALGALLVLGPSLERAVRFAQTSQGTVESQSTPGNLPGPVDRRVILGAWVGPDFRVPYAQIRPTQAAMLAAALLLAAGLALTLWRRRPALALACGGYAVAGALIASRSGIYYTAKTYQLVAMPVACAIVAGAALLVEGRDGRARLALAGTAVVLLGGYTVAVTRSLDLAARVMPITPPEVREMLNLRPVAGRGLGLGLIRDDWTKYALPDVATPLDSGHLGASPPVAEGRENTDFYDLDTFQPEATRAYEVVALPRLGGLSVPPPGFRLVAATPHVLLYRRPAVAAPPAGRVPLEPPGTLGGRTLQAGQSTRIPAGLGRTVLLGGGHVDGLVQPVVDWPLAGTQWGAWTANGRFAVSIGDGGPAGSRFTVGDGGRYRVVLVGQGAPGLVVRVDGVRLPVPDGPGGLSARRVTGTVSLAPGRHAIGLEIPRGQVAYVEAVSLERLGPPARAPVCVGGRRLEVGRDHPVRIRLGADRRVRNCGRWPLWLDWAEPAGP